MLLGMHPVCPAEVEGLVKDAASAAVVRVV
jgi:hypothetical protein